MGNNPSQFTGDAQLPVEHVSWDECQEYCKVLNAQCPKLGARLPTEAEWEYACRAGTASAYNDGSACTQPGGHDPELENLGWFRENSERKTHPVGEKQANAWGVHDAHGNVWEWCGDWFADYHAEELLEGSAVAAPGSPIAAPGSPIAAPWSTITAPRSTITAPRSTSAAS